MAMPVVLEALSHAWHVGQKVVLGEGSGVGRGNYYNVLQRVDSNLDHTGTMGYCLSSHDIRVVYFTFLREQRWHLIPPQRYRWHESRWVKAGVLGHVRLVLKSSSFVLFSQKHPGRKKLTLVSRALKCNNSCAPSDLRRLTKTWSLYTYMYSCMHTWAWF